ncbi:MAG TPA: hypothetical protein PKA00_09565 [Saprospiraceae bacterium]|nr:hypothetical protein [Saprospiraceae bacterium]HMQ83146.1 hypothetical protein [Saprospiraceae bacterium]
MKYHCLLFLLFLIPVGCRDSDKKPSLQTVAENSQLRPPSRSVEQNVLASDSLPAVQIKVADEFHFVGNFDFEIIANSDEYADSIQGKPIAKGERFVFASAADKVVDKLFIVQFEGFLPEYDFTYNYNFDKAEFIGSKKYRHNTWFYNNKELAQENPGNEGAKTTAFLEEKGYKLEDEFMMSRFVGLASEDRKNEIIIFYIEMLKHTTGYSLQEFENTLPKEKANAIEQSFIERSKGSFLIIKG